MKMIFKLFRLRLIIRTALRSVLKDAVPLLPMISQTTVHPVRRLPLSREQMTIEDTSDDKGYCKHNGSVSIGVVDNGWYTPKGEYLHQMTD